MDFRIPWVPNTQNVLKYVKINDSSITGWGCFLMVPHLNLKGTVARIYPEILRESNGHIRLFTNFASSRGKFPNSDSVGFQSLGPGSGATKMHAPKNRNSPGTLLEPCLQPCWNLAGTFLEPCWNLACSLAGTLLEPCWNIRGTLLEPCLQPSLNLPGTLLEPCLQPCWNLPEQIELIHVG